MERILKMGCDDVGYYAEIREFGLVSSVTIGQKTANELNQWLHEHAITTEEYHAAIWEG